MTPSSRLPSSSFGSIEAFLRSAGWSETKTTSKAKFFSPPANLGMDEKFLITLPLSDSISVSSNLFYETVRVLQEIYSKSLSDLFHEVEIVDQTTPWVLKARLLGDSIGAGTISLTKLDAYLSQVTKSLLEAAKFRLGGDNSIQKLQANKFVEKCLFLPTEVGSFVTSIEVPHEEIRAADLITPPLYAQEIVSNWFSALDFLNKNVLNGSEDYFMSDSAVMEAIGLLNIPLAESMRKLICNPAVSRFDFELKTQAGHRDSSTGELDNDSLRKLGDFVKFFRESLINESNVTIEGKIFELRSRDPEGNRNHIAIKGNVFGDLVIVSMNLDNYNYQTAIQAHREGRNIRVVGDAVRLKTQTRITTINEFGLA